MFEKFGDTMNDLREWVTDYISEELKFEDILEPEYKYSNLECWKEYIYRKMAYQNILDEIDNNPDADPIDIVAYEMDRMLRYGQKAKSQETREMFMTAYYACEYIVTVLSEEEWEREGRQKYGRKII